MSELKVLHYGHKNMDFSTIDRANEKIGLKIDRYDGPLGIENVDSVKGYECLWVSTNSKLTAEVAAKFKEYGVKYIVTSSAGYDNFDIAALAANGVKVSNVPDYSPNAIAEYAILLGLALLRNLKQTIRNSDQYNFTMAGPRGRELNSVTAGVLGTGRIGSWTARIAAGFGGRVVCYDKFQNPVLKGVAEYLPWDEFLPACDIIFTHLILNDETRHIVNREAIAKMKDGVILLNNARGGLFDFVAVRDALNSGKISAAGFDVYENESQIRSTPGTKPSDPVFCDLIERPNVIYSPHLAFFTVRANENMAAGGVQNCYDYLTTGACKNELTHSLQK